MNEADKATLAAIERCLLAGDTNSSKALNAAFELGRLAGQLEMAKIGEGLVKGVFDDTLDIMSGKVKPS
jgi:hypothetical protein